MAHSSGLIASLPYEMSRKSRLLKIMQDITQRKRAGEERDQLLRREQAARAVSEVALSAAEAANRSKDEFLSPHELRTPNCNGWAGILTLEAGRGEDRSGAGDD